MGKSFYLTQSPSQLQAASQSFSDLINAAAVSYGLTVPQAASYQTLNDTFSAAYFLAKAPETRTKATVQARRDAKIALVAKAAELAKIIEATPTVTNEQKVTLGLSVRATPTPKPPP